MDAVTAMRVLADHQGLVRFGRDDEHPEVRVMLRHQIDREHRVVAIRDIDNDDPLDVLVLTVQEALAEVAAHEVRVTLRLVHG